MKRKFAVSPESDSADSDQEVYGNDDIGSYIEEEDDNSENGGSDEGTEGGEDEDEDEDDNENHKVPAEKSSSLASAQSHLSMAERLAALQKENEEDSFANTHSATKRAKLASGHHTKDKRSHIQNQEDDDEDDDTGKRKSKHGPAIMRSDRPVKR